MTSSNKIKFNLIIESCKIEPNYNLIQDYIKEIDDWRNFLDMSYTHGVLPLVYKALKQQKDFPQEVLNMFKTVNMQIAQRNMQMSSNLIKISELLNLNNIESIPIKGPVLSQQIHSNVTTRQYVDLDILVEQKNMLTIANILINNGYNTAENINFLSNKKFLEIGKDFTFIKKASNIRLEFHWKLFTTREFESNKINLFSNTSSLLYIQKYPLQTLDFNYQLIYLCLHGSKHFWERIEWVVDIDRLISQSKNIDWNSIYLIVKEMKVELLFLLGLSISQNMFNTSIPKDLMQKIKTSKKIQILHNYILNTVYVDILEKPRKESVDFKQVYYEGLIKDTMFIRIRYYIYTLFRINERDIYNVHIVNYLSPLYYLIKVYRIIIKYLKIK